MHTNDIMSIDVYLDTVASGQFGFDPFICVWKSFDLSTSYILKPGFNNGVSNICFSKDGIYLAAAEANLDHKIVVFNTD